MYRKRITPFAIAVFLIILTALVWTGRTQSFDLALRQVAFDFDPPGALRFWEDVTLLGSGLVLTLITLAALLFLALLKQWDSGRYIAFVMIGAVFTENAMKWVVHRARPDQVIAYAMPSSFSYPSGHALFATAFYGALAVVVSHPLTGWLRTVVWAIFTIIVLAIGSSRIFLGVHYPSDVIGGFLAGALCVAVMKSLMPINKMADFETF